MIVNDFAYVEGGASKVALGSARSLAKLGHRVVLFCAVGPIAPELQGTAGLEVHCLGQTDILRNPSATGAAVQGIWNRTAADTFAAVLAQFSASDTVVHVHTWTKALSASVVRTAARRGFRLVLTMHDYFSACPNGGFFLYPERQICHLAAMSAQCIRTQCDSRSYPHKLWRVARQWTQVEIGGVPVEFDCFISISDLSEEILRPYLPKSKPVLRVPNPVDLRREPASNPAEFARFSFVGRLSPEKGPALLATSAAASNLPVIFVGEGIEREAIARIMPTAELTGWIDADRVVAVLRSSRALVFPSLWYETQGLTVAEAAALGLPAIVSSRTAAREWIEDGVTGLLFEHGNADDLSRKMQMLHDKPEMAQQMGDRAYERYWQNAATMHRHCAALEDVYARLLTGDVSGSPSWNVAVPS